MKLKDAMIVEYNDMPPKSHLTRSAKTKNWLKKTFEKAGIDYVFFRDVVIIRDETYRVELKIHGGNEATE